jgi:hypothetical protein
MRPEKKEANCPCDLCRQARLRIAGIREPLTPSSAGDAPRAIPPQRETGRLIPRL